MNNGDIPVHPINSPVVGTHYGLTKREYFAAMAMQGLLAKEERTGSREDFASDAVKYADALLNELAK